jgi:Tfp pilus assembly protein PilX
MIMHAVTVMTRGGEQGTFNKALQNQNGAVLILALVMLTIMSIFGAMALSSSSTDLKIANNFRASQEAFYAAERAIEYATTSETIYTSIGIGEYALDADNGSISAGKGSLKLGAGNKVEYLTSGDLPPGSGSDPTYFQSRYYLITVTSQGPNNSSTRIESQVARIVPK